MRADPTPPPASFAAPLHVGIRDALAAPGTEGAARAAAALRRLARREDVKAAVLATPALYAVLRRAAARYVAGETRADALATARALARRGHRVTVDFMGEDTREAAAARAATDEFLALLDAMGPAQARAADPRAAEPSPADARLGAASVSLDLSHIGLAVAGGGERLAREHLGEIAAAAGAAGREVIVSMEDASRTDAVLAAHAAAAERHPHVGVTLQAALHRTTDDLARVLARPGRVRLVKGAYAEGGGVSLPRGPALDARYLTLARVLVDAAAARGRRCSVATHDPALLDALAEPRPGAGDAADVSPDALQFEMLHGVAPERLDALAAAGHATRVYVVYGREWYLYLCHRLAEHPPSLLDALADAVDALPDPAGAGAGEVLRMTGTSARPERR